MPDRGEIQRWLIAKIAEELETAPSSISPDDPFDSLGLDSARAVGISGDLELWLGRTLSPTLLWEYPSIALLAVHLAGGEATPEAAPETEPAAPDAHEPIAIVGLGCRLPGAPNPRAYWKLLIEGVDAVGDVPADRWNIDEFYDADPGTRGKMYTRQGGFLDNIDGFDPQFFGITQSEADRMDPQQRLLMEVAWEALEDAAIAPDSLAGSRTGVYVGISAGDYAAQQMGDPRDVDAYAGSGNAFSIAANRISYFLDLRGPSMAIDTACSSSLVALHQACASLASGESTLALAGGVNVLLRPEITVAFSQARMMAADGRCKTFDAAADGYVRGEGCGMVVLKRLSQAQADGDRIYAVVRATAINHDGRTNGLTAPNGLSQRAVIESALSHAGISGSEVDYVEAHGTGTSLGDPIEMDAIKAVYGAGRTADHTLYVGSAKTNIGHLESAAGIAGLIKCALMLRENRIAPHLHFHTLNPKIDLSGAPIQIPTTVSEWPAASRPHRAAISSFGFGGTNAHAILEAAPEAPDAPVSQDARLQVFAISGTTPEARDAAVAACADFLDDTRAPLSALCHTSLAGRKHFNHRAAVAARSVDELRAALRESRRVATGEPAASDGVAFLFTGQGAQYPGMGRGLYDTEPVYREALDHCAALFAPHLERPLLDVMFGDDLALHETRYTQPALFSIEFAVAQLWLHYGVAPAAVIGHSIGEIAAACLAGAFSLEDAVRLVATRSALMQVQPEGGGMLAVLADADALASYLAPHAQEAGFAALNAPGSTVVSGSLGALDAIAAALKADGIASKPLTVSHAFHSPLMAPMIEEFRKTAESIAYTPLRLPLASNLHGTVYAPGHVFDADYWCDHVLQPVRFQEGLAALAAAGPWTYLEVGPAPTLCGLGKRCLDAGAAFVPTLQSNAPADASFAKALAGLYACGAPVDWLARYQEHKPAKAALPTYPFQRHRCWFEPGVYASAPETRPKRTASPAEWVYGLAWEPMTLETPAAPVGDVLLIGGTPGFATALQDSGVRVLNAVDGDAAPFGEWKAQGALPRHVVYACDIDEPDTSGAACLRLLELVRALESVYGGGARKATPVRLWIITRRGQALPGETCSPAQAALWGFGRVLFAEHPELHGGLLDTDDFAATHIALLNMISAEEHEDQVLVRSGRTYAARLRHTESPATPAAIREDASYLVTGGLGGLGLATAQALAGAGAKHLVLLARTPMPPRDTWDTLSDDPRVTALRAIEAAGAEVTTAALDVSDAAALDAFLSMYDGPAVRGVFHAAGATRDALIGQLDQAAFDAVYRAKVLGAWNLHQHFGTDAGLDYFALYSSAAAVLGSAGQANYAAANAWLDGLAHARRANGLPALSINWGPWAEVGMAASDGTGKRLEEFGLRGLPPAEAAALLLRLLGSGTPQATVIDADWDRMARHALASGRRHMLEDLSAGFRADASPAAATGNAPAQENLEGVLRRLVAQAVMLDESAVASDANIFELGIDSLRVIELIHQVEMELHLKLYPKEFIDRPTIEGMAAYIHGELSGEAVDAPVQSDEAGVGTGGRLSVTTRRDLRPLPVVKQKNPPMLFVLSGPRSGSTLFRVMLAGHPDLFCPPELHLLQFDTMQEREAKLGTSYLAEGLQRAFMELEGLDAEAAEAVVRDYTERDATTQEVYLRLQQAAHPRLLADKSPSYASAMDTLLRAEALFDKPLYIHLSRHPYAMIESFVRNRFDRFVYEGSGDALTQGEDVWAVTNCNAIDFFKDIDKDRGHWVRYEDVVGNPEKAMRGVCKFLSLPYSEGMIHPYDPGRMTDGVHKQSFAIGDPNFLQHKRIDPALGQTWRSIRLGRRLNGFTRRIAGELGYELPGENATGSLRTAKFEQVNPVQPEGDLPPIYIAAPATGLVYLFHTLSQYLDADQPVFALQDPALQEGHPPFASIEDLANAHVEAIRKHRASGPYYLAGWSFGGVVAFEIARQLHAAGAEVGGVIIIDADSRTANRPSGLNAPGERIARLGLALKGMRDTFGYMRDGVIMTAETLRARHDDGETLTRSERMQLRISEAWSSWLLRGEERMEGVMGDGGMSRAALTRVPLLRRALQNLRANMRALKQYTAGPLDAPMILLRAEENLRLHPNQHLPDLGWGRLAAQGIRVELIPGNHMSLFNETYVKSTAEALAAAVRMLRDGTPIEPRNTPGGGRKQQPVTGGRVSVSTTA
ncbi:MAG: SDR family NAD(P)-dependent oxidoreductase [Candidatus Hydrogenedens sp.]|nr:SDR family NAD(P)-dependent oxidoreductase [Candidatus Hydrogenedens sp.]